MAIKYGLYVWWQGFICYAAYVTDHQKTSNLFNRVARCQFGSRASLALCFPSEEYFKKVNVPYKMLYEDTHSIVVDKIPEGKTFCSLCSRLRRGILYNAAVEHKCNKIALGHHRDDLLETLLLNIFYAGVMKTMPPNYIVTTEEIL